MGFAKLSRKRRVIMQYEKYLPNATANIPFDPEQSAKEIIMEHMEGYMHGCHAEYDTNRQMMNDMYHECAFILTNKMLEGKLTPMQVAAVRNVLIGMIWNVFKSYVNAKDEVVSDIESLYK
jgi:hypothetical protein